VIPTTLSDVAEVVSGSLIDSPNPQAMVTGAAADTRRVNPGDLFVAIVGARADGHDFAESAMSDGAVGVLGSRSTGQPTVVVDEPVLALGRLARHQLGRLPDADVVAITGSSGKTSTKDLIAQLVSLRGPVVAPEGSFNTEVGLPLTVLQSDGDTRTVVLEMGARGVGHVDYLCWVAPPAVAVVLNVGSAHLGEFGSRDAIVRAKGEIVQALPENGTAVLLADDPDVVGMAARTRAKVLTFGESRTADVRVSDLMLDDQARPRFRLLTPVGERDVVMGLHGEHQALNAAAAAAVGLSLGMELDSIASALAQAGPRSGMRMEVSQTPSGVTLVNDAYNANPESMRAALKSLAAMGRAGSGRTWAVLGEMLELGPDTLEAHDAVGRLAVRLDISRLLAVGEGARAIHLGASHEGSWGEESAWVPDTAAAIDFLRRDVRPGDIVLVKASRGAALERVAQALADEPTAAPPQQGADHS